MNGQISRGRGTAHGEALEDEARIETRQPQSAKLLRGIETTKPELGRQLDGRDRKLMLLVPARGMGFERLIGKGGGRLHIRLLIISQGKIHLVVHSLVAPRLFSRISAL